MNEFRVGERVQYYKYLATIVEIDGDKAFVWPDGWHDYRLADLDELTSVDDLARLQAENARLAARVQALEALMKPFATAYMYENNHDDKPIFPDDLVVWIAEDFSHRQFDIFFGHLRAIHKALEGGE